MTLYRSKRLYAEWVGPLNDLRWFFFATNVRFIFPYSGRSCAFRIGRLLIGLSLNGSACADSEEVKP
jgi:hypothetical protein